MLLCQCNPFRESHATVILHHDAGLNVRECRVTVERTLDHVGSAPTARTRVSIRENARWGALHGP
eukprot:2801728-Rhodomonas_salina.2